MRVARLVTRPWRCRGGVWEGLCPRNFGPMNKNFHRRKQSKKITPLHAKIVLTLAGGVMLIWTLMCCPYWIKSVRNLLREAGIRPFVLATSHFCCVSKLLDSCKYYPYMYIGASNKLIKEFSVSS